MFYLRIGPKSVNKVLRILDALLKALAARGFDPQPETRNHNRASIIVHGEEINFGIEEPSQRHAHRLTENEKREKRAGGYFYAPVYDYIPTGKLTLKVNTPYSAAIRGKFSDTSRQQLEDQLNQVIVSMVRVAAQKKVDRARAEERQRRRNEENARREEIRRLQKAELEKVMELHSNADAWEKARQIRTYIEVAKASAEEDDKDANQRNEFDQWCSWLTNWRQFGKRLSFIRRFYQKFNHSKALIGGKGRCS